MKVSIPGKFIIKEFNKDIVRAINSLSFLTPKVKNNTSLLYLNTNLQSLLDFFTEQTQQNYQHEKDAHNTKKYN